VKIEERLDFATADVQRDMREGVSFEDATRSVAVEYDLRLDALVNHLRKKFGQHPDLAIAYVIEEAEQEATISYIWKINQVLVGRNPTEPQSFGFRQEVFKDAEMERPIGINSVADMKKVTASLIALKQRYDCWLGRRPMPAEGPPEKPIIMKRIESIYGQHNQ
jgi:hypothetical protein